VAAQNDQKSIKIAMLVFMVIQGHCFRCQLKARVRLFISD